MTPPEPMAFFRVTKMRGPRRPHDAADLIALMKPGLGLSVALYRRDTGRRVFTTPVERILLDESGDRFVQTKNSLYRFSDLDEMPFELHPAGNGW